jgi:hypothetical protein
MGAVLPLRVVLGNQERLEALAVEIGDLGHVAGLLEPCDEAVQDPTGERVALRVGENDQDAHRLAPG